MTQATNPAWVGNVLRFWFDELGRDRWFAKNDATDEAIRSRFAHLIDEVNLQPVEDAIATPERALASVIVLDQFTRNVFRGSARAFDFDELARGIARLAISISLDRRLVLPDRRIFLYLPFEHAESLADQYRSLDLIGSLGDDEYTRYARAHCDVIERFGRFPHRNEALGRASTPEEEEFLKQPGSRF